MKRGTTHNEETRKKMSETHSKRKREPCNIETKIKISNAQKGRVFSDEHKKKISLAHTGKKRGEPSQETKDKLSISHMGIKHTEETKRKLSESHKGKPSHRKGKKSSIETCLKISNANRGEKSSLWKGGISYEPYCEKFSLDLKRRVRAFFEHRCVCCGKHQHELNRKHCVHHVEYNKMACCDEKQAHFAALCMKHHAKTNEDRERWENMLHRVIDEIYGGKSYYTKEEYRQLLNTDDGIIED